MVRADKELLAFARKQSAARKAAWRAEVLKDPLYLETQGTARNLLTMGNVETEVAGRDEDFENMGILSSPTQEDNIKLALPICQADDINIPVSTVGEDVGNNIQIDMIDTGRS